MSGPVVGSSTIRFSRHPILVAHVGDTTRLLVSPVAAIGTDLAGVTLASILFVTTSVWWIRLVAVAGGLWMATAAVTEVVKLSSPEERRIRIAPSEVNP